MLVFRDNVMVTSGVTLRNRLLEVALEEGPEANLALLLGLGELEAALADGAHSSERACRELTNSAARRVVRRDAGAPRELLASLARLELPACVRTRRPEGFAYYALDPCDYARLAETTEFGPRVTLIGVRSIGTTLSAIVLAALERCGHVASRFSVRPGGHPFARVLELDPTLEGEIERGRGGSYLVIDEGPGLSGSTFLAVGEALTRAGIPARDVTFFCSHAADSSRLVAENASERWARFRVAAPAPTPLPPGVEDVSAGRWRPLRFAREADYPACWPQQERKKSYSFETRELIKFVGFGPYGEAARECATRVTEAGFTPKPRSAAPGFLAQPWLSGEVPQRTEPPLDVLAEYLAFRARDCAVADADLGALQLMAEANLSEALGRELPGDARLELARPVRSDARLAPHEWLRIAGDSWVKFDAWDHGDDHLFPGPCDIAWDLAGAISEWQLTQAAESELLARYARLSGDDARSRLRAYRFAYAAFGCGKCRLARTQAEPAEQARLLRAEQRYLNELRTL